MMTGDLPGNRWDLLAVAPVSEFTPTRRVSVCIPVRDGGRAFDHLLRSLELLDYPPELLEVVVVDDGSAVPVELDTAFDPRIDVIVDRRHAEGFGAPAARNRAASLASGEILLFLDADMIVDPSFVLAISRWFDANEFCAVLGSIRFVSSEAVDSRTLVAELGDGRFGHRAAENLLRGQEWRASLTELTGALTVDHTDLYRLVTGAALAVHRRCFDEIGGFVEVDVRGVEDTEFGYRLMANGVVLVPEEAARAWHQGPATLRAGRRSRRDRRAKLMAELVPPDPGRGQRPPKGEGVVAIADVFIDESSDRESARAAAGRLVGTELKNVCVSVSPDRRVPARFSPAFMHVWMSPSLVWGAGTLPGLVAALSRTDVSVVVVGAGEVPELVAVTTRELRRAGRVGRAEKLLEADGSGVLHMAARRLDLRRAGGDIGGKNRVPRGLSRWVRGRLVRLEGLRLRELLLRR